MRWPPMVVTVLICAGTSARADQENTDYMTAEQACRGDAPPNELLPGCHDARVKFVKKYGETRDAREIEKLEADLQKQIGGVAHGDRCEKAQRKVFAVCTGPGDSLSTKDIQQGIDDCKRADAALSPVDAKACPQIRKAIAENEADLQRRMGTAGDYEKREAEDKRRHDELHPHYPPPPKDPKNKLKAKGAPVQLIVVNHSNGMLNQVQVGLPDEYSFVRNWVPVGEEALFTASHTTYKIQIIGASNSALYDHPLDLTAPVMLEVVSGGKVTVTTITAADLAKHKKATDKHQATLAAGAKADAAAAAAAAKAAGPIIGTLDITTASQPCGDGKELWYSLEFEDGTTDSGLNNYTHQLGKNQIPVKLEVSNDVNPGHVVLKATINHPGTVEIIDGCKIWFH